MVSQIHRISRLARRSLQRTGGRSTGGVPLPPVWARQGNAWYHDNEYFVRSGVEEVERLDDEVAISVSTRVIDVGCGPGRLAIGWMESGLPLAEYLGVDVQASHVQWCTRHLSKLDPRFRFLHLDVGNARYNPRGDGEVRLPVSDASIDILYAYSVLSHMRAADIRSHLVEARRVVGDSGVVAATAFVEEDVPSEEENPEGYLREWSGPLHCVRYSMNFFGELVADAGFRVQELRHHSERSGQSFILLRPAPS